MMRKDYVRLAEALRLARNSTTTLGGMEGVEHAADYIMDALAADNPRFDRARFTAAVMKPRSM